MAETRTQDNQKVFNSATTKLQSFVNGVQNVSNTKNMEIVYNNMGKMFDAFTNGVLTQQGANSEILLRQVYRSLSDDFLKIIQNSKATDKIVELIKNKQDEVRSSDEAKNSPNITQTTKNVVQNELTHVEFDPLQVITDFVNELQTYVLQIKRDVARQIDKRSFSKQQVKSGVISGNDSHDKDAEYIESQISEQDKFSQELDQLNGLTGIELNEFNEDEIKELFSDSDFDCPVQGELVKIEHDLDSHIKIAKQSQRHSFSPIRIINKVKNQDRGDNSDISGNTKLIKEEILKNEKEQVKIPEKIKNQENVKEQHSQPEQKLYKGEDEKIEKNVESKQSKKSDVKEKQVKKSDEKDDKERELNIRKSDEKDVQQTKKNQKVDGIQIGKQKKYQLKSDTQINPKEETRKNTKLNVKPSLDGMCVCPICGQKHPDGRHPFPENKDNNTTSNGKITSSGVINAISELHGGVGNLLNNNKFKSNFILDYKNINKNVQKQMKRVDKDEDVINKNLKTTEKNIKELKKNKNKKDGILGLIFNPLMWMNIAFIAIGGIILITLTRMALKKFKDTYMPPSDGKTVKIFGIQIPGISEIKSLCIGIYNFATVGIPNIYGKIKVWISGVKKSLFGKGGMFSSMAQVKNTLRKIALAWVIGQTKSIFGKGFGIIGQILKFALKFTKLIPGWGIAISIAVEVLPLLFSFIATQIMMAWSNNKVAMQEKMEGLAKNLKSVSIKQKMLSASKNVSTIVPPSAMPGLQTPKSGSRRKLGGAIMRRVELKTTGKNDFAKMTQEKSLKDEIDKSKDSTKKLYSGDDVKSPIGRMARNLGEVANGGRDDEFIQNIYNTTIKPQVQKLDFYINQIKKSKRFRNVKGPLYDPINGWNPGYRVFQSDLMSPIPMNPFEGIHDKADVKLGEPSRGDESYIGIMPYTWIQNGVQVSVHPLKYELARALTIRKIWSNLWDDVKDSKKWKETSWWKRGLYSFGAIYKDHVSDIQNYLFPKYDKEWRKTSYVTQGGFGNDIVYGDRFVKFLEKFRAGEIDHAQNSMNTVDDMGKTDWKGILKTAGTVALILTTGGMGYASLKAGQWAMGKIQNTTKRISKDASYGKQEKYQSVRGKGFWGGLKSILGNAKTFAKNKVSQVGSLYWIKKFSGISSDGVSYGDVRDMMMDGGILNMFSNKQILAPISKASSLIKLLLERKILHPADHKNNEPVLHDLMWEFFVNREKIAGYEWKKMQTDEYAQAGFSQSLLEYFGLLIMPLWNRVENMLKHVISNNGDGTPALVKSIKKLTKMFGLNSIMEFLSKHLRFKNMKTILIDETNAGRSQRRQIEKFKKELGILTPKEKQLARQKILKLMSSSDQKEIEEGLAYIGKIMGPLKLEAKSTGQTAFVKSMLSYKIRLQSKLNEMKNPGHVSKTDTKITNNTVQIPPKSKEELAKEEAERKRKEEEQRRKEEEEKRKKLESDKKRAEAVAIAKAKIEAMEKIRKQEQNYENILNKMVADPSKVTDAELKSLGDEVNNLKQEAENRINELPRDQRELKLALIRGDKISPKSFKELKDSAIGLGGSLQSYMEEVNKIPCGSIMAVQNTTMPNSSPVKMADSDNVDMGDD